MSTPIDKLKALAKQGWSSETVQEMKDILKASEISPIIPFDGYISDLAPIRFLLHFSGFEEPMIRLLWHRYTEMKLKNQGIEVTLKKAVEFLQMHTDYNYEGISQFIEKQLQVFSPDLAELAKVIRYNYRAHLWGIISQSFEEIKRKELLEIFGIARLDSLRDDGFSFKETGDYVKLEPMIHHKQTQKECDVQMKVLENAISRIEKN